MYFGIPRGYVRKLECVSSKIIKAQNVINYGIFKMFYLNFLAKRI